jgi:hypothetical protein
MSSDLSIDIYSTLNIQSNIQYSRWYAILIAVTCLIVPVGDSTSVRVGDSVKFVGESETTACCHSYITVAIRSPNPIAAVFSENIAN